MDKTKNNMLVITLIYMISAIGLYATNIVTKYYLQTYDALRAVSVGFIACFICMLLISLFDRQAKNKKLAFVSAVFMSVFCLSFEKITGFLIAPDIMNRPMKLAHILTPIIIIFSVIFIMVASEIINKRWENRKKKILYLWFAFYLIGAMQLAAMHLGGLRKASVLYIFIADLIMVTSCSYLALQKNKGKTMGLMLGHIIGYIACAYNILGNGILYEGILYTPIELTYYEANQHGIIDLIKGSSWLGIANTTDAMKSMLLWSEERGANAFLLYYVGKIPAILFFVVQIILVVVIIKMLIQINKRNLLNRTKELANFSGGLMLVKIICGYLYELTGLLFPIHAPFVTSSIEGATFLLDIACVSMLLYIYIYKTNKREVESDEEV